VGRCRPRRLLLKRRALTRLVDQPTSRAAWRTTPPPLTRPVPGSPERGPLGRRRRSRRREALSVECRVAGARRRRAAVWRGCCEGAARRGPVDPPASPAARPVLLVLASLDFTVGRPARGDMDYSTTRPAPVPDRRREPSRAVPGRPGPSRAVAGRRGPSPAAQPQPGPLRQATNYRRRRWPGDSPTRPTPPHRRRSPGRTAPQRPAGCGSPPTSWRPGHARTFLIVVDGGWVRPSRARLRSAVLSLVRVVTAPAGGRCPGRCRRATRRPAVRRRSPSRRRRRRAAEHR